MTGDIRKLLTAQPFVPFTIHTADGGKVRVPTAGHVLVFPQGSRVLITHDDDSFDVLSALLINRLTVDPQSPIAS